MGRRTAARLLAAVALAAVALAVPTPPGRAATARRVAGNDRYETAAALSRESFAPGVPVAYVATGADFPDALAAGPVARAKGGPVLLVMRDTVPLATATELNRLDPQRIVVLGGTGAVSDLVVTQLAVFAPTAVSRVAGADRYATAAQLSASAFAAGGPVAYVATGTAFPDGLAGATAGAAAGGPVLLVTPGAIPAATAEELRRLQPRSIHVLGGTAAVSSAVETQLRSFSPTVGRSAGPDRYATAAAVSANTFSAPRATVFLATGLNFADALAAGAVAGGAGAPVLLVPGSCVPPAVRAEIDRLAPTTLVVLGGPAAVAPAVEQLAPCVAAGDVRIGLARVASLSQPLALAVRAGDTALYVAEKGGRVRALRGGHLDPTPVLDLSGQVSTGSEQGLLGLAFHPGGGFLYVNYTDTAGDTRVVEYALGGGTAGPGGQPSVVANAATRRVVLAVDQPFANHNGGELVFGPDGRLYIGLGDGGSGNDPQDNGQRLDTILGKILRIDPRPSGAQPYAVPGDNPFVGTAGARPEIWALGLRNPWRFSFDRATGDVWIGDVGERRREEIDFRVAGTGAGVNYGWARLEGTLPVRGTPPPGAVPPLIEYPTADGNCAVTGGYVYRGTAVPGLAGAYLYGDYCLGRLLLLRQEGGRVVQTRDLGVTVAQLSSFGEDAAGELYALSLSGGVFKVIPG